MYNNQLICFSVWLRKLRIRAVSHKEFWSGDMGENKVNI